MKISQNFIVIFVLVLLTFSSGARAQSASWKTLSSTGFTPPREGLTSSFVNGKIYSIGGDDVNSKINLLQVYDIATNTWTTPQTQGYFQPHSTHTALVIKGKIYIVGGLVSDVSYADSVCVFDPSLNLWSTEHLSEGSLIISGRHSSASCVIGDSIYVIGGFGPPDYTWSTTVEIYDIKRHSWSLTHKAVDSMHQVTTPKAVVLGNKIYVVGLPTDSNCHCDLQIYDPTLNKWISPQKNSMAYPRYYFSLGEIKGKIYAIGGSDKYHGTKFLNNTEVYDTATNTWSILNASAIFDSGHQPSSVSVGDNIYIIGGFFVSQDSSIQVLTVASEGVEESGKLFYNSRVFPNPATTRLSIASVERGTPYKIIDVFGRVVLSGMTLDHATLNVDISDIPRGIYYVLVERADIKGVYATAGKVAVVNP
jgi:hypothetical protein